MTRKVTLLSNIYYFNPTAEALYEAELLDRFITSWTLLEGDAPPKFLPNFYQRKLEGRRLTGVPRDKVDRLWVPELLQKTLPKFPFSSASFATDINNRLFDSYAKRRTTQPQILHFANTLGLSVSRHMRKLGGLAVCDSRQEHPQFQRETLVKEAEKRGLATPWVDDRGDERTLEELAIADQIIVPSSFAQRTMVGRGIDAAKVHVVAYGVDPSVFAAAPRESRETFTILFVGMLNLRKGILYLLEALKKLNLPNTKLICIGKIEPDIEALLLPYRDSFTHIANVPKVLLKQYYQKADLFVLPSLGDSFGLVVLEAAVSGLPIIITRNVGASDRVIEGKNAFVVPPADSESLAEAIEKMFRSRSIREEMSNANLALRQSATWGAYKTDLIKTYTEKILPQ